MEIRVLRYFLTVVREEGITLTNEGLLLKRRTEEILSLVDKTEKELVLQEGLVEGKIVIGCGADTSRFD